MLKFISDSEKEMFSLLKQMVLIQSGTKNQAGVERMAALVAGHLKDIGLKVDLYPQEAHGSVVMGSTPAAGEAGNLLLIGHMDTVFPTDSDFTEYREDQENAYGPGVADMKGGLVAGIYALKALAREGGLERMPLRIICNPDEEVGSPVSKPIIAAEARRSFAAFILEPSGLEGEVVTGRKGRLGFKVRVRGRAGHAAYAGPDKASAVLEMAHKIIALEALNGLVPGLTLNVGRVQAGVAPNVVPEEAIADVDVRILKQADGDVFLERAETILAQSLVAGTSSSLEDLSRLTPMEQTPANRSLYRLVQEQARDLGLEVAEELRPGCSDGNTVAQQGTPVLDSMGPSGAEFHSDREYLVKASLVKRTQLLALSIKECRRRQQEGRLF
ncbi:MAG: M20 family metallopeptidase [Desulfarculaceae bacterium]|jgi:glutamate carboxypeptidase